MIINDLLISYLGLKLIYFKLFFLLRRIDLNCYFKGNKRIGKN